MKKILSFILLACCAVPMMAQWQMQPTPNDTLQPVRNLGDGKVAFSIYAPNAKEVGFGGDAMPWGKPVQFTKADNGVWTTVISDLKDGVYRYNFTVDGVKVQDPKGALSAETSALANRNPARCHRPALLFQQDTQLSASSACLDTSRL